MHCPKKRMNHAFVLVGINIDQAHDQRTKKVDDKCSSTNFKKLIC